MSPPKLNSLLTGVFVAILIAVGGSAMAQDGLRLWKPYSSESFGGGRRSNDGVYGSLSGIYWSFSTPKGGYIGATTVNGEDDTRWVYGGNSFSKVYAQTNSAKINMMGPTTTLGTRFEVGNRRGHHGWLVSGYGLPNQSHQMSVQNISMVIRDEGNLTLQPMNVREGTLSDSSQVFFGIGSGLEMAEHIFVWDRGHNSLYDPTAPTGSLYYPFANWQHIDGYTASSVSGIGYLWGYFPHNSSIFDSATGVLAPLPILFANTDIRVSTEHRSAEVMYTYRAHPFSWGAMELLAGARYWDLDDQFTFVGTGPGATGPGAPNNVNSYGVVSVLADMTINARGENRIVGPQVGIKLSRQNTRWTFGAEGRVMGGINAQTVKTEGYIATNYSPSLNGAFQPSEDKPFHGNDADVPLWVPIGLQYGNTNFGHKQTKTYFSPIVELRLSTDWQWTDAVSFFGAVDGMFAGNIARGVRVTDYVVHSDGTIFGIRGNDRNTSIAVYGVEAGVKVRR